MSFCYQLEVDYFCYSVSLRFDSFYIAAVHHQIQLLFNHADHHFMLHFMCWNLTKARSCSDVQQL